MLESANLPRLSSKEIKQSNLEEAMQQVRDRLFDDRLMSFNEIYNNILNITIKLTQGEMAQFWNSLRQLLLQKFPIPYIQKPQYLESDIESLRKNLSNLTKGTPLQ